MATLKFSFKMPAMGYYLNPYHTNGFYSLGNRARAYKGRLLNKHKDGVNGWRIQSTWGLFHKDKLYSLSGKAQCSGFNNSPNLGGGEWIQMEAGSQ